MNTARENGGTLDVEFVEFASKVFADKHSTPTEEAMNAQLDKYKDNFSGAVREDNPLGFGYKLPDRLQFDYVALKLEDVARIVPAATRNDAMEFYRQNRRLFTQQVPSDPNDPNSPRVARVRSYDADIAKALTERLTQQKIATKAEQILEEVRTLADANLQVGAMEEKEPSVEQLKARAGDYHQIAQQLSTKHGLPLYSGRTGWLSATDVQADERLGGLFVSGYGAGPVALSQVLFSV